MPLQAFSASTSTAAFSTAGRALGRSASESSESKSQITVGRQASSAPNERMAANAVLAYSLAGGAFRWQAEEPIGVDWWAETASRYAVCAAARWVLARRPSGNLA